MFTLDTKKLKEQRIIYIIATLICILFSMIYEMFSHGVVSYYMILAFIIPLIFGLFPLMLLKNKKLPTKIENNLYNCGVATLTIGSIIQGILEIYGTTNSKVYVYLYIGIALLFISILLYLRRDINKFSHSNERG